MDFNLSEEQRSIQGMVRKFVEREILPVIEELDRKEEFPYAIVGKMAELRLFGLGFPEEYDGVGGDSLSYAVAVEELSRGSPGIAINLVLQSLVSSVFYRFASEAQKREWLPPLLRGERLGSFGLTEANAGSDAGATQTTAISRGDDWLINGAKQFITNGGTDLSKVVIVTAATGRKEGEREISNIIVRRGTPGYTVGRKYSKLGWHLSDMRELIFEDCRVPKSNTLGEVGSGFKQFLASLDGGRIGLAAVSLGLAQAAFDEALKYAKTRIQFGQPIAKFQAIQFKLAEMATQVELSRLILYKTAWMKDNGIPFTKEASMAKLFASEASKYCADQALQIHGGYGFMNEYAVSRFWRDVKANEIAEGTSEIQHLVIARQLGC